MTKTLAPAMGPPITTPFFYGWLVLAMAMVSAFLAAGSSQLFMGIMLKPMSEEMGWSRTLVSGAVTAGTFAGGFLSPLVGALADRHGPRILMPLGACVVSLALLALSGVDSLLQFYLAYVVARSVATVCLGGVVPLTTVTNWFFRMRGRALGLVAMALPLGGSLLALAGAQIMALDSWRTVFLVFAAVTAVVVVVPSYCIMRRRPEDMGLLPDGARSEGATPHAPQHGEPGPSSEYSFTLGESLRTRTLWLLIVSMVLDILANGAVGFHQVAYYSDIGLSPAVAAAALSVYGLAGALSSGFWGFLIERMSPRALLALVMLLAALASGLLLVVNSDATALGVSALYGFAARGEGPLLNMILARYYGRDSFGAISGFTTPFLMLGLGLGPLVGSLTFDLTGTYQGAFAAFAAIYVLTAGFTYLATAPRLPAHARAGRTGTSEQRG
ncbi:MAG: MFS transporter [Chloroflexi bacterium]|nr:MFS transporter [Chloroflexota bacterium]